MDALDRAFLRDVVQFTYLNRIATITALHRSLRAGAAELDDIALETAALIEPGVPPEPLRARLAHPGDAARVERILCAKIFAEFIAACEDLGAFGYAVRERASRGIFRTYFDSLTRDVDAFFRAILRYNAPKAAAVTLEAMLNLPAPATLAGRLPDAVLADLAQSYREQALSLHAIARLYRYPGVQAGPLGPASPPHPDWPRDVNVLLGVVPADEPRLRGSGGILVRAYNKLKHRFTVTEHLPDYYDPAASELVDYGRFSQDPTVVATYMRRAAAVAGATAEIAAIVSQLDAAGIPL